MLTNCGNNIDVFQLHQGRNLFVDYKEISFQDKILYSGYFFWKHALNSKYLKR